MIALFVFGIGGYLTYYAIKQAVSQETDYEMVADYRILRGAIESGKPIDALQNEKVAIKIVQQVTPTDTVFQFSDTMAMHPYCCLLYTSPSPRDRTRSRMPSSA